MAFTMLLWEGRGAVKSIDLLVIKTTIKSKRKIKSKKGWFKRYYILCNYLTPYDLRRLRRVLRPMPSIFEAFALLFPAMSYTFRM